MTEQRLPAKTRDKCGKYAGWNAHQAYGEEACGPCRTARNDYTSERRKDPKIKKKERDNAAARARALARLAKMFPREYRALRAEERNQAK